MKDNERPVLSPAEALNPITVGSWHADKCSTTVLPSHLKDVLPDMDGPSIISALGLGYRRTVKPDIFYDGGRALACFDATTSNCALRPLSQSRYYGQKTAAPSARGFDEYTCLCGTSNAAALVTRQAIRIHDMLVELGQHTQEANIPQTHFAVLLKALLVHGCTWGEAGEHLEEILKEDTPQWQHQRTLITRLLGFGRPDVERVLACTAQRATMISWGTIEKNQEYHYNVPLPQSLSSQSELRRMTVTIAWMTPVNPVHQQYRQAALEPKLSGDSCGIERKASLLPTEDTIKRGTIAHHIYEGERAIPFPDNLPLSVVCREQGGGLDDPVPFALAVSFEVGIDSEIDVYEEIRTQLAVQPRAAVPV